MDFFTIMIILITLVVFVFIVLISFVLKKSKDVKTQEFLEEERKKLRQTLLKKRKKLLPYKDELYLQITNAMTFERLAEVRSINITGYLYTKHQKPIVAFERVERGMNTKGQLIAITKKQEFVYEFQGSDITLFCDDTLLGSWDKSGILYDADKKRIGHAKRSVNQDNEYVLVIHKRDIASIKIAPLYDAVEKTSSVSHIFEELNLGTSLLSLHCSPSLNEEKWILPLLIFEMAFYGNTTVN
ncbi:hypothetical protein [Kordia sp.]|uniref:hypothetical protein n=1 Tax=Kordia sp. TaxID=1965332 RepID=UPI003D6C6853